MKRIAIVLIMSFIAGGVYASSDLSGCLNLDPTSGSIVISTTPGSPTQIFAKNSFVKRTWLNLSNIPTSNRLFLVGDSTSTYGTALALSTSTVNNGGSFFITGGSTPVTLDGQLDPYKGDLWGVLDTATTLAIQKYRCQ